MVNSLNILIVEDSEDDALLLARRLNLDGKIRKFHRVDTREDVRLALQTGGWDIVLLDYQLRDCTAEDVLVLRAEHAPDVPAIVVSGTIGEERAAALMKAGADDLVIKDNFSRLAPSIDRELENAETRRARVRSEIALGESEEKFRSIFEMGGSGIAVLSTEGNYLAVNPALCRMLGYSETELSGMNWRDVTPEKDLPDLESLYDQNIGDERKNMVVERQYRTKDGHSVWANVVSSAVLDDSGRPKFFVAHIEDITARRNFEQTLQDRNVHIQGILDNATNGIVTADEGGTILTFNRSAETIFGFPADEAIGRNIKILMPESEAARDDGYIREFLRTDTGKNIGVGPREITGRRKDGTDFPAELGIGELVIGGQREFIAVFSDLTARKEAEHKLQQAQKMESVGHLTGGIAHDFNNILAVILGNLELLKPEHRREEEIDDLVQSALEAVSRGSELTKQLLAFSRRQELEPRILNVNELVAGMDRLLRRTLGEHIEIVTQLDADLGLTKTDPAQLESALLNLSINARDAMPKGGKLLIETANAELDDDYVAAFAYAIAGSYICISVCDTGTGISQDKLGKIFEPFYTTKEVGKGTGLGLSMVYGFVKQSGGHINVYSELGHGTRFRIYLPRTDEIDAAEGGKAKTERRVNGTETILVVEDEEKVRNVVMLQLKKLGYRTIAAEDAQSAIEILESNHHIDLMMTDMIMPGGMSGNELAERAKEMRPDLSVLLTSGYPRDALKTGRNFPLISKPYGLDELSRAIRDALSEN